MKAKPSIVLVHGAWGDGAHWKHVIPVLVDSGYTVRAVQNPLSSLKDDVEKTKDIVASLPGPVLLVGHSYGGVVITEVGNEPNVAGLVYVAAFAPDTDETVQQLFELNPPPPGAAIIKPDAQGYLWLDFDQYPANFCGDVPAEEALVMAITQKPLAASIFGDKVTKAAWKEKPSWYQISSNDKMIPPATEQLFADRMKPKKTISLPSSHASMASHGKEIADFIVGAASSL
jgi:pimeloyl-ACP methyl ester carboxylesterase